MVGKNYRLDSRLFILKLGRHINLWGANLKFIDTKLKKNNLFLKVVPEMRVGLPLYIDCFIYAYLSFYLWY